VTTSAPASPAAAARPPQGRPAPAKRPAPGTHPTAARPLVAEGAVTGAANGATVGAAHLIPFDASDDVLDSF
jgi:hypothetical protein